MRNFLALLSVGVFCLWCTKSVSAQISNGGFESGAVGLGEWQYVSGAVRDATNPHGGLFAANLNNLSQTTNTNVQQQTLVGTILAGETYTLNFFAQAEFANSGIGQAQVAFLNSSGNILLGSPQFININTSAGYVQYSQTFLAPTNSSALFIGFNAVNGAVNGAISHVYIDDVRFTAVPEPSCVSLLCLCGLCFPIIRRTKICKKKPQIGEPIGLVGTSKSCSQSCWLPRARKSWRQSWEMSN